MTKRFTRYQPVKVPRMRYTVGIPSDLHASITKAADADRMTISDWLLDAAVWKLRAQGWMPRDVEADRETSQKVAAYSVGRMLKAASPYLKGIED